MTTKKFKFRLNWADDFEYEFGRERAVLCQEEVLKFLDLSRRVRVLNLHISDERPQDDDNFHVLRKTPNYPWRLREIDCESPLLLSGFGNLLELEFPFRKTLYAWAT